MPRQWSVNRRARWNASVSIWLALLVLYTLATSEQARAQTSASASAARAQTLARVTAVRDDFVERVRSSGLACTLPPPRMEIRDVASFGEYEEASNAVVSTDWTLLGSEQKAPFFQMAGPGASEQTAHATFEDVMHRSMLVHELAHWWEACHKVVTAGPPLPPFQRGVRADRITVAYWREADPALPSRVAAIAQVLVDHTPSPVPAGQKVQEYFNQNYERLDPSVQPWFVAQLYLAAYKEIPPPSLSHALALSAR